ncbi:S1 family peptidase [Nocardia arthritidis]|uniref:Serine protease n=1 Tax=Nocardia arthritidis TaxID=228602 RepID=A0A6G9YEI9_9NOCA|nr:S1 family peptidase [Nocardia arthritidis]QIS11612.1 hypothetical protein F5544_18705 [Nocardia arthritidis]
MPKNAIIATAIGIVAAGATIFGAGTALADPGSAVLGGGSGIVLGGHARCSLTTIGHDGAGRLVGLTAGHCAAVGDSVTAEHDRGAGVVGNVVASDRGNGLDYAVIEFDAAKVTPVRSLAGTTIAGFGPAPGPGATVCSNGRSSGFDCGVVWGPMNNRIVNQSCSIPGDSGGPVTMGDRLVGMNQGHLTPGGIDIPCVAAAFPLHTPAYFQPIDRIMQAVDGAGGVGAGLQPV